MVFFFFGELITLWLVELLRLFQVSNSKGVLSCRKMKIECDGKKMVWAFRFRSLFVTWLRWKIGFVQQDATSTCLLYFVCPSKCEKLFSLLNLAPQVSGRKAWIWCSSPTQAPSYLHWSPNGSSIHGIFIAGICSFKVCWQNPIFENNSTGFRPVFVSASSQVSLGQQHWPTLSFWWFS